MFSLILYQKTDPFSLFTFKFVGDIDSDPLYYNNNKGPNPTLSNHL